MLQDSQFTGNRPANERKSSADQQVEQQWVQCKSKAAYGAARKRACTQGNVCAFVCHSLHLPQPKKADKNKGKGCLPLTVKRKRVILLTVGGDRFLARITKVAQKAQRKRVEERRKEKDKATCKEKRRQTAKQLRPGKCENVWLTGTLIDTGSKTHSMYVLWVLPAGWKGTEKRVENGAQISRTRARWWWWQWWWSIDWRHCHRTDGRRRI